MHKMSVSADSKISTIAPFWLIFIFDASEITTTELLPNYTSEKQPIDKWYIENDYGESANTKYTENKP